jgi:acyl-CoA thioester hydrolase
MSDFNFRVPMQVRFNDLDFLGHVTNAVYQFYYNQAGTQYCDSVILQKHPEPGEEDTIVMATITIDYLKSILYNSSIAVEARVAAIGRKSFAFASQIIDLDSGEVYSRANWTEVCFSRSRQKSIPLPELWRQRIMAFEKNKPVVKQGGNVGF